MEWNIENIKFKHNKDGVNSRKAKIIDAVATTPAAIVAGGAAGGMAGSVVADTINFGPTEPASKSTTKILNKAIKHHDLTTKVFTGRSSVQQAIKDKQPGAKGYATASMDKKPMAKGNPQNVKDLKKLYRKSLKGTKIVVPAGNAKHVLLHELGHVKQFHSPARMVTNATLTKVVRPG